MDALEIAFVLVFMLGSVVGGLVWRGYRSRVTGGPVVDSSTPTSPGITTGLGRYRVEEGEGKLWIERPGGSPTFVWLRDIERVHVSLSQRETPFEELFLEGWKLTDFMHRYRDYRARWEVSLLTKHSPVVIAELEQYKKRDFFDLATPVQLWILRHMGFYADGERVVAELRALLERHVMPAVGRAKQRGRERDSDRDSIAIDLGVDFSGWG